MHDAAERSENVSDGNADMNANRKSDGPIVSVKRANKAGIPVAEFVEERESPKRSSARSKVASDTVLESAILNLGEHSRLVAMATS